MTRRLTRAESQALTKGRLLDSARRVFLRHGYGGSSVTLMAEEAGYSKGAIYSNFVSKEAIFLDVLRGKLGADIDRVTALARNAASVDALLFGLRAYLEASEEVLDFTIVIVEFLTSGERTPEGSRACAALYRRQRDVIGELLGAVFSSAKIEPPAPPEELAAGLVALTLGLAAQRAVDRDAIPVSRWSRQIETYLRAILAAR